MEEQGLGPRGTTGMRQERGTERSEGDDELEGVPFGIPDSVGGTEWSVVKRACGRGGGKNDPL